MTGLLYIYGIAGLFAFVLFCEMLANGDNALRRPAGLLRWLASGNWPAKIGAALLVISSGALLRYLILNVDLPAKGKIYIGIVAVVLLAAIAVALRNKPRRRPIHLAFGGAALGVAYLTAYSAYDFFHFITDVNSLGLLFVVATAATMFALTARSLSIAILAMVGAFIAPAFALAAPNVFAVFGYYLLASTLVLLMVSVRGWRPLVHLSFLFTLAGAGFFSWTHEFYRPEFFSQMHPLLLALVAMHLLMPILESVFSDKEQAAGEWQHRFDVLYFLLLPLTAAALMILVSPDDAVEGAMGLVELACLWLLGAAIQQWRHRSGASRYLAVAVAMATVAACLAFRDVPYFLIATAVSCATLGASRLLGISTEWSRALLMASSLIFGVCYMTDALFKSAGTPPFLNAQFACQVILSISLAFAAFGSKTEKSNTLTPVFLISAIVWLIIATVRELIQLHLDNIPQIAHVIALGASAIYAGLVVKRAPSLTIVLLLALAVFLTGMFASQRFSTPALFVAMGCGQLAFLAIAHFASTNKEIDADALAGLTRSLLPVLIFPIAIAFNKASGNPHVAIVMSFLVTSALVASLHAQLTMPQDRFWPNTLSPVGFVIFSLWLFYQTLLHIERDQWAIFYELIGVLYIVQTVLSMRLTKQRDTHLFGIIAIFAVVTTSTAMFLRAYGPDGTLTILALNDMLLPAVVSLFWAGVGGALTWWGTRMPSRRLWILGAVLLVAAAIKLVLFDFGSLGQLGNILAMMAAGGVFMAVAWFAPFPPQAAEDVHEAQTNNSPVIRRDLQQTTNNHRTAGVANTQVANEQEESSRKWLWILAGLGAVILLYHAGSRDRSAPAQEPGLQTAMQGPVESPTMQVELAQQQDPYVPAAPAADPHRDDRCIQFANSLPNDYEILVAGGSGRSDASRGRPAGSNAIEVLINKPGKNILLALGAEDPITWKIQTSARTRIVGVVISGTSTGEISGQPTVAPILFSSRENGAPCGYFAATPQDTRSAFVFISKLLTRAVDEVQTPTAGHIEFGVAPASISSSSTTAGMFAPYGIRCDVPSAWNRPATSCSGKILASGTMANADDPETARRNCEHARMAGSCCMYHLYGKGSWYLTDGAVQIQSRTCETESNGNTNDCNSGGACFANR